MQYEKLITPWRYLLSAFTVGFMFFIYFIWLVPILVNASDESHVSVGWAWYNQPHKENTPKVIQPKQNQPEMTVSSNSPDKYTQATQELKAFKQYYQGVHDYATLHPDDIKAVAYDFQLRNYMYDKSKDYGVSAQKAALEYPHIFDTQMTYPTQRVARSVYKSQKETSKVDAVKALAKSYGLFYFYNGKNRLDQLLSSSIQSFADQYHIGLIGVSMDGVALNTIKENRLNQGQAKAFHVKAYPAVFVVNPYTHQAQALAYGFISEDELLTRFYNLATDYDQHDVSMPQLQSANASTHDVKLQGVINV